MFAKHRNRVMQVEMLIWLLCWIYSFFASGLTLMFFLGTAVGLPAIMIINRRELDDNDHTLLAFTLFFGHSMATVGLALVLSTFVIIPKDTAEIVSNRVYFSPAIVLWSPLIHEHASIPLTYDFPLEVSKSLEGGYAQAHTNVQCKLLQQETVVMAYYNHKVGMMSMPRVVHEVPGGYGEIAIEMREHWDLDSFESRALTAVGTALERTGIQGITCIIAEYKAH